jgi:hypothetical protein
MSDYFEYLTRTMTETYRERNQLLAERRKAQEEESKQKKLQLQNGENGKVASKKQTKTGPLMTPKNSSGVTNDENQQSSPSAAHDDNGDVDSGGDEDLKTVIQRRRQMVAMSKELKEKRELEAQKLHNEQKRELAIQKAEQAYQVRCQAVSGTSIRWLVYLGRTAQPSVWLSNQTVRFRSQL